MKKTVNILFCGTGGQGVLSAAEICSVAAMYAGLHVKKSEVHGMAQRGGSVESHVRFGEAVYSPLIPLGQGDFLVSFYKDETDRLKAILRPQHGIDLTYAIDLALKAVSDKRFANVFILGVLSRKLELPEDAWAKAIETVFRGKSLEENLRVFKQGREAAQ